MSFWAPPPPPPTKLGVYRTLSPLAGIHVSPLQLGAMSIGDKWGPFGMGKMDKESSFKLLDAYFDNGGNFIDTANAYQDESSEMFIGEWAEQREIRDQVVLATKYTMSFKARNPNVSKQATYIGNNIKSMHLSVEASLKKLRTTYIDILYLHWWDWDTSVEEVMNGLHNLVVQGKVLYLGVSDTPAWVVAEANRYARDHGKSPFVIYQGMWNVMDRSFEREIIPMARAHGLALAPWSVLARGKLRTDAEEEQRRATGEKGRMLMGPDWERNENEKKMSHALEKVANEVGANNISAVAIAYVMQKVPYCFPIIGGRKVEHLMANVEALDIALSPEQIEFLENVLPFDAGFPNAMIGDGSQPNRFMALAGAFDKQPILQAIRPAKV
ncbi:NADP-dependent oxidoreductase domain-containing protein [Mycena galericulata]|nr:NADP-dependent oxidoreductase domain-containing protein [Mycena galericulata]KAJ7437574.1 NADP-dependent oxidoreductase domain-containing protein [Mycena galericulata]